MGSSSAGESRRTGGALAHSILGSDDPATVGMAAAEWVLVHGRRRVTTLMSCQVSVGAAITLILADGGTVVLKVLAPGTSLDYVHAMRRVQSHLFAAGFPGPEPLAGPAPFGRSLAVLDQFIDVGEWPDGHTPLVRRAMAAGLARLVKLARDVEDVGGLAASSMSTPPGRLWPRPHNALFDFEATSVGAEWIDKLATTARKSWQCL